jgi:hypothetical protein
MKYMVMLTRGAWEDSGSDEERQRIYGTIVEWWGRQAADGKIVDGLQLQPAHTATTVVLDRGSSTLVDGPFMEAKESIGGFAVVDVADLDEAIAIWRTFPSPDGKAEIRPVLIR